MHWVRGRVGLAFALLFTSAACTTTSTVSADALSPLQTPGSGEALILTDAEGRRIYVDPNTRLRFRLHDGRKTPWLRARSLRTGEEGVYAEDGDRGWSWADIAQAEVKNFSGAKTFALIVGSAAVVATVVAVAAASKGKCCFSGAAGAAEATVRVAHATTVAAAHTSRAIGPRPAPARDIVEESEQPGAQLFTGSIRRRSVLDVVPSMQAMLPPTNPSRFEQSAALSVRVRDVWELGGVVRAANLPAPGGPNRMRFIVAARAGLHLDLDGAQRFAIPLLIDVGGGPGVPLQTRLNLGLRIRATETIGLGLYAPSPTLTRMRDPQGKLVSRWSFPAGLELSFTL